MEAIVPIKLPFNRHPAKGKYIADHGVEQLATDQQERVVQRAEQIAAAEQRRANSEREITAERLRERIERTQLEHLPTERLKPNPRNARKHPKKQIALLAANIAKYGFTQPIVIDEDDLVLAGHGRLEAAKLRSLAEVPVVRLTHLSATEKRALALADNKLAELGEWDFEILEEELKFLTDPKLDLDFDPMTIGFETPEIDQLLVGTQPDQPRRDPADEIAPIDPNVPPVTRRGDLWHCGENRLLCGNSLDVTSYRTVMNGGVANIVFTDSISIGGRDADGKCYSLALQLWFNRPRNNG